MKFWQTIPFAAAAIVLQAQGLPPAPIPMAENTPAPSAPLYQVTVVQQSAKAINYGKLKSSTKIDFKGSALMPNASGMAKVKCEGGGTRITAKFKDLPAASSFGGEYLTYVLWAISTEGRATNLGELVLDHGKGKLKAVDPMQCFGLVVTAEPYFAVTSPSDVVVMENAARKDATPEVEYINARFDLLKRGQYTLDLDSSAPMVMDEKTPFDLYQARNAVRIARAAGAATYAQGALTKAVTYLAQSEAGEGGKKGRIMEAREAVQSAEDARLIAVQRQAEAQLALDRQFAQARLDAANREAANASAAQAAALQQAALAGAGEQAALNQVQRTEAVNAGLQAELLAQFNAILQTRATARGLIVNMSGVLFQNGKAILVPAAREKLAKIAGILSTHKGLMVEADGFTDSTGSLGFNQRLSEQRAGSAMAYLVEEGVATGSISSKGFGVEHPIASNTTNAGRQENRRVELVISGEGITTR